MQNYTKKLEKSERIGKVLVVIIAVLNLLAPIANVITDFRLGTLLSLVLAGILSAALFSGVTWVRYLFALGAGINVFYLLFLLLGGALEFTGGHFWVILLMVLQLLYSVAACLLLLFSKSVKEFLYR